MSESSEKKQIAILGGSGFIGSRFCTILNKKETEFAILDKVPSKLFPQISSKVDVRDCEALTQALKNHEVIVNLAAEHRDDVSPDSLYYEVNVDGARNICEAARHNGIEEIVFTSSVAIYGLNKPNPDEAFTPDPFNHYGKSKLEAEKAFLEWYHEAPEERKLVIIRPTVVFGEENRGNVYNLLRQISSGKFLRIGSGLNKKSMAYVGNVASFIDFSIHQLDSGLHIFNYVDKPDLNMNELVEICEKSLDKKVPKVRVPYALGILGGYAFDVMATILNKSLPISSVRVKKFCATTQFDASKAHGTGFKKPYSLEEGLHNTLTSEFK